jgi:hypothetical protein
VSDYGLDPDIAAAYGPAATALYLYPGMESTLADRLDGVKAASTQELQELCREAYDQRSEFSQHRQTVAAIRRRLGAHGPSSDPLVTAELVKGVDAESDLTAVTAQGFFGLKRSDLHGGVLQADYLHYFSSWKGPTCRRRMLAACRGSRITLSALTHRRKQLACATSPCSYGSTMSSILVRRD